MASYPIEVKDRLKILRHKSQSGSRDLCKGNTHRGEAASPNGIGADQNLLLIFKGYFISPISPKHLTPFYFKAEPILLGQIQFNGGMPDMPAYVMAICSRHLADP